MFFEMLETDVYYYEFFRGYREIIFRRDSHGDFENRYFFEVRSPFDRDNSFARSKPYADIDATDKLTYDELDKIFYIGYPKYNSVSQSLWSLGTTFLEFSGDFMLPWSRRGAVYLLVYTALGEAPPPVFPGPRIIYHINDNWYIFYYFVQ